MIHLLDFDIFYNNIEKKVLKKKIKDHSTSKKKILKWRRNNVDSI